MNRSDAQRGRLERAPISHSVTDTIFLDDYSESYWTNLGDH
jgi:hypothetical protein